MKNNLLIAIVCIGLGVANDWVANKEDTPDDSASNQDHAPREQPKKPSTRPSGATPSERTPGITSSVIVNGDELSPDNREAADRWAKMFEQRQKAKIDARIAKLVADLQLTPDQEAQLRKLIEEKYAGASDLFSGNGNPSQMAELAKLLGGNGVDDLVGEILTPEQKDAFGELKEREWANKVEAKALKNLAKLSFLDMSQEQKDAAYDILYKEAEESSEESSPEGAMVTMITDSMGIDIDVDDLGIGGIISGGIASAAAGEQPNPAEMMKQARENQAKRIDEKVEALSPVLDDNQQEAYRKHLESKSNGMFGGLLQMGTTETPDPE